MAMLLKPKCSAQITATKPCHLRGTSMLLLLLPRGIYEKPKILDKIRIMGLLWLSFKCTQCHYIKDLGVSLDKAWLTTG